MSQLRSKVKGKRTQNRVARIIASITGLSYGDPNDDSAQVKGRCMGQPGKDIMLSNEAKEKIGDLYIECKHRAKAFNVILDMFCENERKSSPHEIPILIVSRDFDKHKVGAHKGELSTYAIIRTEELMHLLHRVYNK